MYVYIYIYIYIYKHETPSRRKPSTQRSLFS